MDERRESKEREEHQHFQVIGSGFGRTGTNSLKLALEILYGTPCYHMIELEVEDKIPQRSYVIENEKKYTYTHSEAWLSVAMNGIESVNIKHMLRNYSSAIDFPASAHYKDLMKVYPGAKIILTVRDDANRWYDSACATIYSPQSNWYLRVVRFLTVTRERIHFKMVQKCFWQNPKVFDGKFHDKEVALQIYHDWVNDCKNVVDRDRLLIFNVKEGWGPLCEFLGLPIPIDIDFPSSNNTQSFNEKMKKTSKTQANGVMKFCLASGLVITLLFCAKRIRR